MTGYFAEVLIIFLGLNGGIADCFPLNNIKGDSNPLDNSDKITDNLNDITLECTVAAEKGVAVEIKDQLNTVNLIKFYLHIQDSENPVKENSSLMFKPLTWMRTTGRPGTTLLLLRPEIEYLSLATLEIGVAKIKVDLKQNPPNCLQKLNDSSIEKVFRRSALNGFQNSSTHPIIEARSTDSICNMHIINSSGYAKFQYICCQKNEFDQVYCDYLHEDVWQHVLFVVITILKFLVVLCSPKCIPDSWYRRRHAATPYKYSEGRQIGLNNVLFSEMDWTTGEAYLSPLQKVQQLGAQIALNTVITSDHNKVEKSSCKNTFKMSKFKNMNHFKTTIDNMEPEVTHRLTINEITLEVNQERLLREEYAPVGLFRTLYDSFVQCQIHERESVNECCNTEICIKLPCKKPYKFYNFIKYFMKFVLLLLCTVPWILRVGAYYKFEHKGIEMRKQEASRRELSFPYPGNVTLLLTPTHFLFIAIYICLAVELFGVSLFGTLGKRIKEKLKFVIRKCFRGMREMSNMDIIDLAVKLMLYPFTKCGIVGCVSVLFWPFILPLFVIFSVFHIFPTINITIRLLMHFFTYIIPRKQPFSFLKEFGNRFKIAKVLFPESSLPECIEQEKIIIDSYVDRLQQQFIIVCCIMSMYSIIFLGTELLSAAMEIFVYTMMGLVLNSGKLMPYISLLLLLLLYGYKSFGHVTKSFLTFNRTINGILTELAIDKVESIISTHSDSKDSFAVRVTEKCEIAELSGELIKSAENKPMWKIGRLLLFIDNFYRPLIPTAFYFKACKMSYYAAPGSLLLRYLSATFEFGMILLFLIFVLVVVLAFGDSYNISTTNQFLATVAGGLLPLLLRQVLFKSYSIPDIDKNSIHFKVLLNELFDAYDETWPVYDIDVVHTEKVENGDDLPIDLLIIGKKKSPQENTPLQN